MKVILVNVILCNWAKSALSDCQTSLYECFNYGKFHERVQTPQHRHHKDYIKCLDLLMHYGYLF